MTTQYLPIAPQPSGDGLDSPLDGEWLNKEFNGLCVPKISDLPHEFNEPNPFTDAGVLVGVVRMDGRWYWECIRVWPGPTRWVLQNKNSILVYYPPTVELTPA